MPGVKFKNLNHNETLNIAIRFNPSMCGCGKETIVSSFAQTLNPEKKYFIWHCGYRFIYKLLP